MASTGTAAGGSLQLALRKVHEKQGMVEQFRAAVVQVAPGLNSAVSCCPGVLESRHC